MRFVFLRRYIDAQPRRSKKPSGDAFKPPPRTLSRAGSAAARQQLILQLRPRPSKRMRPTVQPCCIWCCGRNVTLSALSAKRSKCSTSKPLRPQPQPKMSLVSSLSAQLPVLSLLRCCRIASFAAAIVMAFVGCTLRLFLT